MMLHLRAWLYRLNSQLERLKPRETWMLAITITAIIGVAQIGVSTLTGWQPSDDDRYYIRQQERQAQQLRQQIDNLRRERDNPQQDQLQARIDQLQSDIARTDSSIAAVTDNLITPEQMVRVLRRLLEEQNDLTLRRLQTLPVERSETSRNGGTRTAVYRHGLTMELDGSFNAVARYIQAIENSEWQIYWRAMHYEIDRYPTGRLRLTLYTLSNAEGWLDV
ncbi:hypothetical protein E4656_12800 [Natronospirillum operosum]|uniref:MSHA biogenesis protein MshJ n=1 Tax=Natronospirillum operosum TaxID=2759953 RepID=A0A4Z0WDY9_9GAMM|nr:FlxA-like family protein [Natronospirillum operosum]TGG92351.1 hypothetical protein E4656_12800 [Natronospirillum operosum]